MANLSLVRSWDANTSADPFDWDTFYASSTADQQHQNQPVVQEWQGETDTGSGSPLQLIGRDSSSGRVYIYSHTVKTTPKISAVLANSLHSSSSGDKAVRTPVLLQKASNLQWSDLEQQKFS